MSRLNFAAQVAVFFNKFLKNEQGLSDNTIASYSQAFQLLVKFLNGKGYIISRLTIDDLTRDVILSFLDWLESERHCGIPTRNIRLAAIRSFFDFLAIANPAQLHVLNQIKVIKTKKAPGKLPKYLTVDGIRLLLSQPDLSTASGIRELALLGIMYDSAARVQEIIDLTAKDLTFKKQPWVLLHGKGSKDRQVALSNNQKVYLQQYLKNNKLDLQENCNNPVFSNAWGEPLTRAGVGYILKKNLKKARDIDKSLIPAEITCHSLRHSKAVHLVEAGVHIMHIRDILGHSSVITTEKYARLGIEYKAKALENSYVNLTKHLKPVKQKKDDDWLADFLRSMS